MVVSWTQIMLLSRNEIINWWKLYSTRELGMVSLDCVHGWSVWGWTYLLKLHLSVDLRVFDLNTGFNVFIGETESALFVILFLSECSHGFSVVFMWCWFMLMLAPIEHCALCIAESPSILGFIEILNCFVFYVVKTDRGPSRLNRFKSLLLPKGDWWNTVP